jgi:2-polyprenyl-3-methyl-5-hydroxy-6-metoxy-1,4-benzoquinol methylase
VSQICEAESLFANAVSTTADPYADKYAVFNFHDRTGTGQDVQSIAGATVRFDSVYDFPGWDRAQQWITDIIQRFGSADVLEVGSGANPTLDTNSVSSRALRYTANDVSAVELDKADKVYDRWVSDLSTDPVPSEMQGRFDLVFSRMVNEHVSDGQKYHANIHKLLRPGGISAHCFSTLYSLPFSVNRLVPESASNVLLNIFMPRDACKLGKFRAHYSWSRGPSASMLKRFDSLGYDVLDYRGYFGHAYYCRIPALHRLEAMKARWLLSHPMAPLCSYGMLIARKRSEHAD